VRKARTTCGLGILSSSCLFSIIIAISLPAFYNADITRLNFNDAIQNATGGIDQVRFGNWNYCVHRNSLEVDPCQFFSPCNLSGKFRMCSPLHYGYTVKIQHVTGLGDINVSSSWTKAFIVYALAAGFAVLSLLTVLMRRPNRKLATLSLLISFVAAVVSVAFRHFAGNRDTPGMALAIIACMLRCFECVWTFGYKNYIEIEHSRRRIWNSLSYEPVGPIHGKSEERPHTERIREVRSVVHLYECPLCWEAGHTMLTLLCLHIFCSRCIIDYLEHQEDKRCPQCNEDAVVGDLRMVLVEDTTEKYT